jgi:hypothetical protein
VKQLNRQTPPPANTWTVKTYVNWMNSMGNDASDFFGAYPVLICRPTTTWRRKP